MKYGSNLYVLEQIAQPILAAPDNQSFFVGVGGQVYHYDFAQQMVIQQYPGKIVGEQYGDPSKN